MTILKRIIEQGTRISGNGSFPALNKSMLGKKVMVTRQCLTWDGCLGYFKDDKKKKTFAFWSEELE